MNARIALCFLTGFFLLPAWAGESQPSGSAPLADSARRPSSPGAVVEIVNIKDGAVVPTTFLVQFSVAGMDIAPAGTDIPNTGHHHLLVDVEDLPDLNLPLPKNEHILHFGGGQSQAEITLSPGPHTLQLVFADYAHVPHDPAVKSVPITIVVSEHQEPKS
jgi:hypothetical protein